MKQEVTCIEAVNHIVDRFNLSEWKAGETKPEGKLSFYSLSQDGTYSFFFDKREFVRSEVVSALQDYFLDKYLPKGNGCAIDGITILFTVVRIGDLNIISK